MLLTITHASTSRTPEATSNNTTLMLRGESRRKTFTLLRRARKVLGRNSKPKWKRGLPAISTQKGRPPTVDIHTHTRAPEPVISFGKKVTVAAEEEGGYVYRVLHDHAHASKLHTHTQLTVNIELGSSTTLGCTFPFQSSDCEVHQSPPVCGSLLLRSFASPLPPYTHR